MEAVPSTPERPAQGSPANGRSTAAGRHYPLSREQFDQLLREHLEAAGKVVRRDRLDRDWRAYRWAVKRMLAERSNTFRSTHQQAASGIGVAANAGGSSRGVVEALNSLQALGLLRWGGVKRYASSARTRQRGGMWQCLEVELRPTHGPEADPRLRAFARENPSSNAREPGLR